MDVNPDLWKRRENGTVDLIEIPREDWTPCRTDHLVEEQILYRWRPPYQLMEDLPSWYDFCLLCSVLKNGTRRFVPVDKVLANSKWGSKGLRWAVGTEGLSMVSALGGYTILVDRGEIAPGMSLTFDESRLFLQYVRHMREHLGPTTKLGRVLHVCAGGRADRGSKDILPEDLGVDREGKEPSWDLIRLRAEGLSGAKAAGFENPTPDQILRFGLLSAARINPLSIRTEETNDLVRLALFDLGKTTEWASSEEVMDVDRETREKTSQQLRKEAVAYVAGHVKSSLKEHRHDTTDRFDRWLADPKSDLIHRISKRKDCKFNRQQVRESMLEIGWQSFGMLGQCIDAQMRAFRESLPVPLTETENSLFSKVYLAHPAFGRLPLLLLRDRYEFLKESILATWNRPDDEEAVAILHTMMHYYSVLTNNRRAGYRRYKRRAQHKTSDGRVSQDQALSDEIAEVPRTRNESENDSATRERDQFAEIPGDPRIASLNDHQFYDLAEHFRELSRIECGRSCTCWEHNTRMDDNEQVTIDFRCECGKTEKHITGTDGGFARISIT